MQLCNDECLAVAWTACIAIMTAGRKCERARAGRPERRVEEMAAAGDPGKAKVTLHAVCVPLLEADG